MTSYLTRSTGLSSILHGNVYYNSSMVIGRTSLMTGLTGLVLGPLIVSSLFSNQLGYYLKMVFYFLGMAIASSTGILAGLIFPIVKKKLIEEDIRSQAYLHKSTGTRLRYMLNKVLLESQAKSILNHALCGLSELIQNNSKEDLKRLYRLFCRIQQSAGVEFLKDGIKEWIKENRSMTVCQTAPTLRPVILLSQPPVLQRTTTRSEVVQLKDLLEMVWHSSG
ncbi:hypothetical protein PPACK8108_LOCUS1390 [Phakopsora pachyrhizi]|uniref:Cullin N-terminal domain-containing protein n=1 Tax=Phakopsora pachyrhizi TaxID=170000 RepID=A0AAV0AGC1_PHAPC|nr:hypothetical protein PPACK8108_LOCUS1390 [Phakopsora pachyrhizi]